MKVTTHTTDTLTRYRKKLESLAPISDEDFQHIIEVMHEKQLDKGEVLLREGQVCKDFYFIVNGCIRSFGLENGREVNVKFFFEDDTACDYYSFRYEEPSQFYLVAMEDTDVYCAAKSASMPVFLQGGVSSQTLLFRFFQELFLREEEHSNNFKLLSPEKRYNFLLEHKPQYLTRIPLIYLASYLGVSRETLTRIRKKIS